MTIWMMAVMKWYYLVCKQENFLCFSRMTMVSYLTPKKKSFGNFIVSTDDVTDDDLVIFYIDPGCRGGSMQFEDLLKNKEQKSATEELSWHVIRNSNKEFFTLPKCTSDQLSELSNNTENSLAEENSKSETKEEKEVEKNRDDDQSSNEMQEQQLIFNWREVRNRGNRHVHVIVITIYGFWCI